MARPKEPWKRERLLDAAVETAARTGLGRVTVKEIAETAGVSPGTVHYHFSDVTGVILGVIDRALEEMYDARLAAIATVPDIHTKLLTLIDLGIPDEISHELSLMYEGIPVIRAQEHFAATTRSFVERQVSLYRSVIDAGIATGDFHPRESADSIARNLLALEDANVLYLIVGAQRDPETARGHLRSYAAGALGFSLTDDLTDDT